MNLPPPTFRVVLALAGATLVLWGAKGVILLMSPLGALSLFEMNRNAAWVLVIAAVGVVATSWLRVRSVAWLAWLVAVGSLVLLVQDLSSTVTALRAVGMAPSVDQIMSTIVIKPGAVALICGLVIQAVGLSLKRKV